ncbi:hypothetical protein [Alienimonas sp. DA493]|uniref:hypothetical protein n=1 Tax=Alienimonas sp. DA493 TaxID=3373605 RepID=UPI0037546038
MRSPRRSVLTALAVAALCLAPSLLSAQPTSALRGDAGGKRDPAGILPDVSFAGDRRGERPRPDRDPTCTRHNSPAA